MEIKEFFEPVLNLIKGFQKKDKEPASKQAAKDRLKLVLMQDRASVSPDFFDMMKQEIIDVIKKYIEIDEESLEVELTRGLEVGLEGPALYANIPIKNVKPVAPKSEENSALSEEEADRLADTILTNIENVVTEAEEAHSTEEEKSTEEVEADTISEVESDSTEETVVKTPGEIAEEIMAAQKKTTTRRKTSTTKSSTGAKKTTTAKAGTRKKKAE